MLIGNGGSSAAGEPYERPGQTPQPTSGERLPEARIGTPSLRVRHPAPCSDQEPASEAADWLDGEPVEWEAAPH
ncbi:hypothetical protein VTN96DRAFT_4491 [Rasamsonia emersonii]